MNKKEEIKAIFNKYINLSEDQIKELSKGCNLDLPKNQYRHVMAFTTKNPESLLNAELAKNVCDYIRKIFANDKHSTWLLESGIPVPIVTAEFSAGLANAVEKWKPVINKSKKYKFRFVSAIGSVSIGNHGSSFRLSYGSTGQIMADIIRGCMMLDFRYNWADKKTCDLLNIETSESEGEQIGATIFYPCR